METKKPEGANACEYIIGLYTEMINYTYPNVGALKQIYRMILEDDGMERWPAEYRDTLFEMFLKAIRLAEQEHPKESGQTIN